jgi:uncharacterized protein (UPF0276 family)
MSEQSGNDVWLPTPVGVGLRAPHFREFETARPAVAWLEVHAENFICQGPGLTRLTRIRRDYELSLHGVGLSLGSAEGIDQDHLKRFRTLIDRTQPFLVSEHLSWSVTGGVYLNDLLPLPYTDETLAVLARNISTAQDAFGRRILIENPSRYLQFRQSAIPEPEFLAELTRRTGCGILLDVNNVFVTCINLDLDAEAYLEALSGLPIDEIHLAGHSKVVRGGSSILIDDHASIVCEPVWQLYARALERFGVVPSLIEWDKDLPPFATLFEQAQRAERIASNRSDEHARAA